MNLGVNGAQPLKCQPQGAHRSNISGWAGNWTKTLLAPGMIQWEAGVSCLLIS